MMFFSVTGACSFPFVWGLMAGLCCCASHGGIISTKGLAANGESPWISQAPNLHFSDAVVNIYSSLSDEAIKIKPLILKEHNNFSYLLKFEPDIPNGFKEILFKKLEILQRMYGSLTFLPLSNLAVLDGRYFLQHCF